MEPENRVILVYEVKPNTPAGWLAKSKSIGASTTANASMFTAIAAILGQLANDTQALDGAQAQTANKGKDAVQARNAKASVLRKSLRAAVVAVQGLCDNAADAAHAKAIAAAAGIDTRDPSVVNKPDFHADAIGNGAVQLFRKVPGKRGARVFYEWQMLGADGKTWISLPSTNDANLIVPNLTRGTEVSFRSRTTTKNVPTAWSDAIAIVVS
jgi:hypothetical protein